MPQITPGVQSGKGRSGTPPSRSNSSDRLVQLETAIRNGQGDYVAVGSALTEIQSARLYKAQYNTFEEYCEKQWGFTRDTAYDYINACGVLQNVDLSPQNLPSFTQARELARLEPGQQRETARQFDFKNTTVKDVKGAVDIILGKEPIPKPAEPKEISLEAAVDSLVTKIVMQPYGYYAAKFSKYSFQHTTDLAVVEQAKLEVYQQIQAVCEERLR